VAAREHVAQRVELLARASARADALAHLVAELVELRERRLVIDLLELGSHRQRELVEVRLRLRGEIVERADY